MKIPLAGVIGSPISHSKSPMLHGHWLKSNGLAGYYIPMDVAAADLPNVLGALPKAGFKGVNITLPHKEAALRIADEASAAATQIGAANTLLFRDDGTIFADNTDGYGFIANLRAGAPNWDPSAGPAVVLGAGGASRAVVFSLLEQGVPKIILANRTHARADELAKAFGPRIAVVEWDAVGTHLADAALVVNTTSLGMVGKPPLEVPLEALGQNTVVTDLVYTPLETPLLHAARARGCEVVDGLGMLLHQGVPGFEAWFGVRPIVDDTLRAAVQG